MKPLGRGCLILFSLPFAAIGVGMAIWLAYSLHAYLQIRNWVKVPAQILQVDLVEHCDGDGSTYETTAQYEYIYEKTKQRGTRVGLEFGSDNIGSFQHMAYRELKQHQENKTAFRCFVNPDRPAESILYRELRWAMVFFKMAFIALFGGAGFGMLLGSVFADRGLAETVNGAKTLAQTGPETGNIGDRSEASASDRAKTSMQAPWLARTDWADGKVVYSETVKAVVVTVVALTWNAAAAPTWMAIAGLLPWPGGAGDWVIKAVAAAGILGIVWVASAWRNRLRDGISVFGMASLPGVIGGQLAGAVQLGFPARPENSFRLTLCCLRRITKGSGEDASTSEEIQWQSEHVAAPEILEASSGKSLVPVLFEIPFACRPTESAKTSDRIVWRLEIAAHPRGRYRARFEVPVFKTPASDANFVGSEGSAATPAAASDPQADLGAAGVAVAVSPDGDGLRFFFPSGRNRGMAISFTIFSAVTTAATCLAWQFGAPLAVIGFCGLFSLLFVPMMLDIWLYQSTIDVSPTRVAVQGGWLGIGRRQEVSIGDVLRIDAVESMKSGSQAYYSLVLVCSGGKKIRFAKRVQGNWTARGVIRAIEQAMGWPK